MDGGGGGCFFFLFSKILEESFEIEGDCSNICAIPQKVFE